MAKQVFDIELVIADRAFSHDYNFFISRQQGITLASPIVESRWDSKTKKYLEPDLAEWYFREFSQAHPGVELSVVYPFRNRGEGWHNVFRKKTGPALISRPNRSTYPQTKAEWKKENPTSQYVGLPEDPDERDAEIVANQQVGTAVENEFRCRRFIMALRAIVKGEVWYNQTFDPFADRVFEPCPQDEAFSVYRLPEAIMGVVA